MNPPEVGELRLGDAPEGYKSGFVSIIGRPNVGKSTLVNQILRYKVAITSERPQTTRTAIRAILTTPQAQLVFVDTPGLHKPHSALGKRLNRLVRSTLGEVDVVVFVVDAASGIGGGDTFIARNLRRVTAPVVVALNKADAANPDRLAGQAQRASELGASELGASELGEGWEVVVTSARSGAGIPELVRAVVDRLPTGPLYYPPDAVTDQPLRQIVAELVREQVLELTSEEVPHSVAVVVDEHVTDSRTGFVSIESTIYVERDSQKGIVIGKGGSMLREIGTRARREIEAMVGNRVFLRLRVKVERDWQRREALIERFGYGA